MSKYTKADFVRIATTHLDLGIREAAAEALYQCGRADAAIEMREAIRAKDGNDARDMRAVKEMQS